MSARVRGNGDGGAMEAMDAFRCDVFSPAQLMELVAAPLPLHIPAGRATRILYRDLYLDTPDDALRRRGVSCRLRVGSDDQRVLSLHIGAPAHAPLPVPLQRVAAAVRAADPRAALAEDTAPLRRLRAIVDPELLGVRVALEVERWVRGALPDWLRRPCLELHYDHVTVRREDAARDFQQLCVHRRHGSGSDVARLAHAFEHEHGLRPATTDRRARAELLLKWMQAEQADDAGRPRRDIHAASGAMAVLTGADALDPELSLLAFQARVLSLAERATTPLGERLRFLAIVSANLDEFFSVRMAARTVAAAEAAEGDIVDGRTPHEQLETIAQQVTALVERQYRCWRDCAAALAAQGVRIVGWAALEAAQRAELRARFREEIYPSLTPLAMTLSPGHPFPRLPHLALSVAVVLRDREGGPPRFSEVEVPPELPRFVVLDGAAGTRDVVPVEEVIRGNLDVLHPGAQVDQACFFRVTRGGELGLDEDGADDLLEAVDAAARRRPHNGVVRLEVERGMPAVLRDLVLGELRRERGAAGVALGVDDVYEIGGPLDLRGLATIELPDAPALHYPPFHPAQPLSAHRSMFEAIAGRDRLVHHPFESFEGSVVRFLGEAAVDPAVTAIKITLYRLGDHSPVGDALVQAARCGKSVVAFVELKARFDEARNVRWARALEKAGGRVVYGLKGLKAHAKVALVVRREAGRLRRYVHVGTGNYDVHAGLCYTDLSLFSASDALTADVTDLFNELTSASAPPSRLAHGALVAPEQLLPALLEHIEREAVHARAGREAWIRIKVNGLSDGQVARALHRAAGEGVRVELAVRGICTLRPAPDAPGGARAVRVVATVGRFLEHSRIYAFANGGDPRYYIGSADLRSRNLRHRVELLVPVRDAAGRATLDRLLALYLADESAWELTATGEYVPRAADGGAGRGAQDRLLAEMLRGAGTG